MKSCKILSSNQWHEPIITNFLWLQDLNGIEDLDDFWHLNDFFQLK